jgi:hypothetical protein
LLRLFPSSKVLLIRFVGKRPSRSRRVAVLGAGVDRLRGHHVFGLLAVPKGFEPLTFGLGSIRQTRNFNGLESAMLSNPSMEINGFRTFCQTELWAGTDRRP